jgi:8-oxo-dGTP pyrophosphatase MutT (NUDIX family)
MPPPSSLHFSTDFCISCGTITLDTAAKKVLLIFSRPTQEYLLPKGRKNANETLEAAAVRETFEETGVRCALVAHGFPNLAPPESHAPPDGLAPLAPLAPRRSTEPIAVQQRMSQGAWKLIFWFVARADSTVAPVQGTQEEWEAFDSVWADADAAAGMMAREDDAEIVRMVVGRVLETVV